MPDGVDDEILKMQHLEAEAKARMQERSSQAAADSLKTRAQKMAYEAQQELEAAQKQLESGEAKQQQARVPGTPPLDAADLLTQGTDEAREAKTRLIKGRARLNFALDQMDEAERQAWDALQTGARADAHGQLADET
ncbi:MAG TPA: hypothetical protein VH083_05015 [Myxococcales bacterium]|jgi:hypothetical protein|nr:hypothetical protein [Myxococcales bacterium]